MMEDGYHATEYIDIPGVGWLRYPLDDDVLEFLREGWYEYKERAFIHLYLHEGDVVIDGGAHVGLYTAVAAKLVGERGCVYAVEPSSCAVSLLRDNVESLGLGRVAVFQKAFLDYCGKAELKKSVDTKSAYDSLYENRHSSVRGVEVCDAVTIDQFLLDNEISKVDFVKLDIEGAEMSALHGARMSISRAAIRVLMVEFTEANLANAGNSSKGLFDCLVELGYTICTFDESSLQLVPYEYNGPIWYENLFAVLDLAWVNERLRRSGAERQRAAVDILNKGRSAARIRDKMLEKEREAKVLCNNLEEMRRYYCYTRRSLRTFFAERSWLHDEDACLRAKVRSRECYHLYHYAAVAALSSIDRDEGGFTGELSADGHGVDMDVSVVICTYNPDRELLENALMSIACQTLNAKSIEVIVVDNNSSVPVDLDDFPCAALLNARCVRESRQGLIYARLAGIRESTAEVLVFVDDDNFLAADYLEAAVSIARENPDIGAFGGVAYGDLDADVSGWVSDLLPYLGVRDYGSDVITSSEPMWGEWEPIGAGMVVRRSVALAYERFVNEMPGAGGLGRKGKVLLSCEDSLFARVANMEGYACSYQPALRLCHHIPASRLKARYLFRLIYYMGVSYVRLYETLGRQDELHQISIFELMRRLASRFVNQGMSGVFVWVWNLGYIAALRKK